MRVSGWQALDIILSWLKNTGQFEWVKVEADDGGFLDDVQALRRDGTLEAWQVKFSTNPNAPQDAWTWRMLLEGAAKDVSDGASKPKSGRNKASKPRKRSLLQKWCATWEEARREHPQLEAGLLSNRRASAELAQVLEDAARGGRAAKVVRWEKIPPAVRKRIATQLGGAARAREFLSAFAFCLEEPGLDELEAGAFRRFEQLGGTPGGWSRLERAVRLWAMGKDHPAPSGHITIEEVYKASGLRPNPVRLSAFRPPSAFFASYLQPERAFHHGHALVGRREPLATMLEFIGGSKQIGILPGRGGNGKTRLLLALCRKLARRHPDLCVRLATENLDLTPEAVKNELPDAEGLVIVDDAHRVKGLESLLAAANENPKLQVLLVTRPHATAYLVAQARYAGIDGRQIEEWPSLPDLSYPNQTQRLARRALGSGWGRYAHELASATRDCPLLTVLGGKLLRERQVPPALLLQDEEFRREVLSRFRDIVLGHFAEQGDGQFSRDLCRRVLPLIAVASPLPLDHARLISALAALAQTGMSRRCCACWTIWRARAS